MLMVITDDTATQLDATIEIEDGAIVLHSRGGTRGSPNARNTDYSIALRLILRRLTSAYAEIKGAWVDSKNVQKLPLHQRVILTNSDFPSDFNALFTLMSRRMQSVGRSEKAQSPHGNSNKRIRLEINALSRAEIIEVIQATEAKSVSTGTKRLPTHMLRQVSPEHIWSAINDYLREGPRGDFGPSARYDLIFGVDQRLPPKEILGRAATLALGFEVGNKHFSAGVQKASFNILEKAGYLIVEKGSAVIEPALITDEDRTWAEGNPRLLTHVKRERAHGLAAAKKAEFIRIHGRLFCERCNLDPVTVYGSEDGQACIEVHHEATTVANMPTGHLTKLSDLQCLCANCHRYIHRVMKRNFNDHAVKVSEL